MLAQRTGFCICGSHVVIYPLCHIVVVTTSRVPNKYSTRWTYAARLANPIRLASIIQSSVSINVTTPGAAATIYFKLNTRSSTRYIILMTTTVNVDTFASRHSNHINDLFSLFKYGMLFYREEFLILGVSLIALEKSFSDHINVAHYLGGGGKYIEGNKIIRANSG